MSVPSDPFKGVADDYSHPPVGQLSHQTRQSIVLVFGPAEFDRNILALDEPRFLQSPAKRRYIVRIGGGHAAVENTDHRHRWLLRACREWTRSRAAEKCDEVPPSHGKMPVEDKAYQRAALCVTAKMVPPMTLWVISGHDPFLGHVRFASAGSTGHCNTARSLSAGVSKPKVLRGR